MSYMVLARRWRPQRFSDLVGQDVVVRTLQNAMKNKQMAHAYLLTGIRGTGKTTIARLLAMVVNCKSPVQGEPCGECSACTSISGGNNLDVQEIDAASHTGVDDIREILDGVRYPPSSLNYKVYIIDESHMLSKSAFNALLKTLEEPPERVLFLLATTEADKLPITVRSRCQRFDLRRLGADEISRYLAHVLGEEKVAYEAEALHAIAHAADGSVRDALSLTERVLAYAGDTLDGEHVRHALGLVGPDIIRRLSDAVLRGEAEDAISTLRTACDAGNGPRSILLGMSELWHDLACIKVHAGLLDHEPGEAARAWLKARMDCWDTQALDLRYQILVQGLRDLMLVDERQAANMLLIRLCALNNISPPQHIPEPDDGASHSSSQRDPQASAPDVEPDTLADAHAATEAMPQAEPAPHEQIAPAAQANDPAMASKEPWKAAIVQTAPDASQAPVNAPAPEHSPEQEPASASFQAAPALDTPPAYASWEEAVETYGNIRAGVSAMLEHVLCLDFGAKVKLALDAHQERAIVAAERLAFAEWLGREVHWEPKADQKGETLSEQRSREAIARQRALEKSAQDDSHVQAVMQAFDGKIEAVRAPGTAGNDNPPLEERT